MNTFFDKKNKNKKQQTRLDIIDAAIKVIAKSYDGLPEAAIMNTEIHPFMIAVQFHPERLAKENEIHKRMRSSFFAAMSK